jgi:hypothetical protein
MYISIFLFVISIIPSPYSFSGYFKTVNFPLHAITAYGGRRGIAYSVNLDTRWR